MSTQNSTFPCGKYSTPVTDDQQGLYWVQSLILIHLHLYKGFKPASSSIPTVLLWSPRLLSLVCVAENVDGKSGVA